MDIGVTLQMPYFTYTLTVLFIIAPQQYHNARYKLLIMWNLKHRLTSTVEITRCGTDICLCLVETENSRIFQHRMPVSMSASCPGVYTQRCILWSERV